MRAESQLLSARVKAALSAGQPVRISEQELNVHLASTIQYRQNFALRPWVVPTGIYLSLQADQVELCLERQIGTHPHHSQLVLSLLSTESITPQGRIAELNVAPHSAMVGRLKLPALLGQTFHTWYPPYAQQVVNYYQSLHLPPCRLQVLDGELLLTPLQPPSS